MASSDALQDDLFFALGAFKSKSNAQLMLEIGPFSGVLLRPNAFARHTLSGVDKAKLKVASAAGLTREEVG